MNPLSDREFQTWLDALERGEALPSTLPPEDAADLAMANHLFSLRSAPGPQLVTRVREIMASPPVHRWQPGRVWQRAAAGILAALVLALTMSLTPTGTWAQEVFQSFGMTFLPGIMPQWREELEPPQAVTPFSDEAEALAVAGFPLRWPTAFPFDRTEVAFSGFVVWDEDGAWLNSLYADSEHRYLEVQVFWQRRPAPWPVGDARFQPVMVAGHEGLWAEGMPRSFIAGELSRITRRASDGTVILDVGGDKQLSASEVNVLMWEDGNVLYVLVDPERQFTPDDLLAIAQSAYQVP